MLNNRRHILYVLLFSAFGIMLLSGCATSLSNSWTNFQAYYNTYYNAQENFRSGLQKVKSQPRQIDPQEPVRIHPIPVQAGDSDFKKAIAKGAKILRKFPSSKYIDDALLLIGRSYYYRLEYYPALQKFEELRKATEDPEMIQKALIWKGRALLDLNSNTEAVTFLENELAGYPPSWSLNRKGEIQALLGEHHAMLKNWSQADTALSSAVENIENTSLRGRTYFLLGQVLERQQLYSQSFNAYSKVSQNFPGFEYVFWSGMKRADVARKDGNYKLALEIYRSLSRDDKNFERIDRLKFEIGRTQEMRGALEKAEKQYKDLLYTGQGINNRTLKGEVYYRLGKIYSDSREDFRIAAAYFDTASNYGATLKPSGETKSAQSMADAFGKFNKFQNTIGRADSLLWLGSLSREKLDSVLNQIRRKKREQLLAQQQEKSTERLKNQVISSGKQKNTSSSIYGFLNHRNDELVKQGKTEFRIIWGDRPLVDNWRRGEAIQSSSVRSNDSEIKRGKPQRTEAQETVMDLNVEEIPRTTEEKLQLKNEKRNAQYELGNLLFLNLGMYESARPYFYRIIQSNIKTEVRPRAMYSLVEIFRETNQPDSLQKWKNRILEEYPESRYALRIQGKEKAPSTEDVSAVLKKRYQQMASSSSPHKLYHLRQLALDNRSHELAPYIHYQAIEGYIKKARRHREVSDSLIGHPPEFNSSDSLVNGMGLIDSLQQMKEQELQFQSVYWDSVRFALQEFDTTFSDAKQHERIEQLLETLKKADRSKEQRIPTCEDLGISLEIEPNRDSFLSRITYPEKLKDRSLAGEIVYEFTVSKEGEVLDYKLKSPETNIGIEESFETAIEEHLEFKPLHKKNIPEKVRCRLSFPIKQ